MKCYYEVLGIGSDADISEIKTAYRKLALRWHPDKNPDQLEEAKEQFQLLHQAYEVLSDFSERSWYDKHRDQILRGRDSDYENNSLDLFEFFTVSCFNGYGDDPGGFYDVYGEVFRKISAEDEEFMDDKEAIALMPQFGSSNSNYNEVVGPFYAYWQSYCTKKTYTWLYPYNINEIKDRRVLREMEKEMKKVVQKAKRERNEEVRNLVSFVRKRDKRVQANKKLLEQKAALNRQKQTQNRLNQIWRRQQEMEEHRKKEDGTHNDEYEAQLLQLAQEYCDSDSENIPDSTGVTDELADLCQELDLEESTYADDLYCVACNKSFKNDNAFLNHEASKKHRENVEKLKTEIKSDMKLFEENENLNVNCLDSELDGDEIAFDSSSEGRVNLERKLKEMKNKKARQIKSEIEDNNECEKHLFDILEDLKREQDDWSVKQKGKRTKTKRSSVKFTQSPAPNLKQAEVTAKELVFNVSDMSHICMMCKTTFDSKNKLFSHLKQTGHSVYLPKTEQSQKDPQVSNKKGKLNNIKK